jgi:uncharacterized membrane protein
MEKRPEALKPDEKVFAGFAYLLGLIPAMVIFLIKKDESPYIRFHAMQAALYAGIVRFLGALFLAAQMALLFLTGVSAFIGTNLIADRISPDTPRIYLVVSIIMVVINLLGLSLMALIICGLLLVNIIAAIFIFAGKNWRYPVIGNWAERLLTKRWGASPRN